MFRVVGDGHGARRWQKGDGGLLCGQARRVWRRVCPQQVRAGVEASGRAHAAQAGRLRRIAAATRVRSAVARFQTTSVSRPHAVGVVRYGRGRLPVQVVCV